jgi:hypothetical protein
MCVVLAFVRCPFQHLPMPATTKYVGLVQRRTHKYSTSNLRFVRRHHQWSKIQQKKGINDQRRGQVYARVFRVSKLFAFFTRRAARGVIRHHPPIATVRPEPNVGPSRTL